MILKVLRYPNPILKKKAKTVKKIDLHIRALIDDMEETMRATHGIGLAAPQVGESIRVIIANIGEGVHVIINPKIVKKEGDQEFMEGCLSVPGVNGPVKRPLKVKVQGLDRNGSKIELEAEGLLAVVLQHEVDHLDGKVFIDRIPDPSLIKHIPPGEEKKEELI